MLNELLSNKIFLAVIISAILSQGLKIILSMIKDKRSFKPSDLFVTGGMPSTQSALVSSLLLVLCLKNGLVESTIIALVLFIIVITDSMGVRRTAGEEGKLINKIIQMEKLKLHLVRYAAGHKPTQVAAGVLIGVLISILVWFI